MACTIVAGNYLAFARVLARSFNRHHPGSRFVVLCIDNPPELLDEEPFEVWTLADLGVDQRELMIMAAIYSVMEFATALKPFLLDRLLVDHHDGPVVYLDPDIEVYASLVDVVAPAMTSGIVVTPHLLDPLPRDGLRPNEADLLSAGIYNLGFLAVGPEARTSGFLSFWSERLRRDALVDPARMQFTDQRWVDFLPMFPHVICRDRGCNVAYWNVSARTVGWSDEGTWTAGDEPLRFFHFSGFDPTSPQVLSRHQGRHARVRLPDHPPLFELCAAYAARLIDEGHQTFATRPYGWATTSTGVDLTGAMRRGYRLAVLAAEVSGEAPPPNPFDAGGDAFFDWLVEPTPPCSIAPLLQGRWDADPGLRALFPELSGTGLRGYLDWVTAHPTPLPASIELERQAIATTRALARASEIRTGDGRPLPGLNIFGYLDAELSIGVLARSLSAAAATAGISFDLVNDASAHGSKAQPLSAHVAQRWEHDLNVLCVNADRTRTAVETLGPTAFAGRLTAGFWSWETPVLPADTDAALSLVDEVWVNSTFVADAIRGVGRTPRLITQAVTVPSWKTSRTRADLDLPEGFLVLCAFDWMSVAERKNPFGMLDAFTRAFADDPRAQLVFKTINGDLGWADLDALRSAVDHLDNVSIIDRSVRSWEMTAYLQHADCVLSLHRSEGFGLLLAEAMACARPVIATGYSGNLDFMDPSVAHLVPATLVDIPADVPVYGGLGRWAEPDVDAAAAYLVRVRDDPEGSRAMGERARSAIAATRNVQVAGRSLSQAAQALRSSGGDRR